VKDEEEKETMMQRVTIQIARPERGGTRTVVRDSRDYGLCFFQLLHQTHSVERANPGYRIFCKEVLEDVFSVFKNHKV